jgi:hypothetical protein
MKIATVKSLRHRVLRFLFQTLAFLILFAFLFELIGQLVINRITPMVSLGVNPTPMGMYFEIKWFRLQQFVKRNGGVDVILIGSSVVNTGLDADTISKTFTDITGKQLRVYNFGVEGLDIVPNSVYAKILVEKYHPALLIFGTVPRDYLASDNADVNASFVASPWILFESGAFNFTGWLIDNSNALGHYLRYRNWMRADFFTQKALYAYRTQMTSTSGNEAENKVGINLDQPPDPNDPNETATFAKYHDYQIDPSRLESLQKILDIQKGEGTRVIVMNMPVQSTFYDYMGGQSVYQQYEQTIASATSNSGGLFIASDGYPLFPPNYFSDRGHLNFKGNPILSTYLGRLLAAFSISDSKLLPNILPANQ